MLSVNCVRSLCSSGSLLARSLLRTSRQPVNKTVTCPVTCSVTCSAHCMTTSFIRRDTWDRNLDLGKERKLQYYSNPLLSLRSYSTGQTKLNCWSCKQPLDSTTAEFFCSSCKIVQPPEEGTSYFKIMDW